MCVCVCVCVYTNISLTRLVAQVKLLKLIDQCLDTGTITVDAIRRPIACTGVWRSGEKDMYTTFMVEV